MTNEEIDEVVKKGSNTTDRWGAATYSVIDVKRVANQVNAIMQERLNQQAIEIANSNFKTVLPRTKGGEK